MNSIKYTFYLFLLFSFTGCIDDEGQTPSTQVSFEPFGLENRIVSKLDTQNGHLFAATDNGIYKRNLTGNDWEETGLQGLEIAAMDIKDNNIIASVSDIAQEDSRLYISNDAGETWVEVENDFGGEYPEPIKALSFHPSEDKIYGAGYNVIAMSENSGQNWEIINGEWGSISTGLSFVEVHPSTHDVWSGGQNAIEGFMLYKLNNTGAQQWTTLLPSPSVAKEIAFHPTKTEELIVGAEGGILRTINNGDPWTTIKDNHEDSRFFFGIAYDPSNPAIIYAGGWLKNFTDPQPLILYISEDNGQSWEEYKHPDNQLLGGVYEMLLIEEEEGETDLYLGLCKGGVFKASVR